ncbi:MAG: zinc-binding dehydrogenase [Chloroflexi bacterium]|nr:zinc-binding dehydrogenase [Chloroflexota bacterium]
MKVAVSTGEKRKMVIKEFPIPKVTPGSVLLKVRACSICGSDLEFLDGSYNFATWGQFAPGVSLGHEFCGEIAQIGEGVEGFSIGERVTIGGSGRVTCGKCIFCRRGLYNQCVGGDPRRVIYDIMGGYGGRPDQGRFGALAEYNLRPARTLQKVPDHMTDGEAALVEPFATGVGGADAAGVRPGDSVVIIGCGKIGLGAMLASRVAGATTVIMVDVVDSRLQKAKEMGASAVINPRKSDVVSEVVKLTESGPDAVIVCVRDGAVLEDSVEMVRRGGIIVLVGFVPKVEMNPGVWVVKQLRFVGTQGGSVYTSWSLIKNRIVDVRPLITETFPLTEIQAALDSMYSGKNVTALVTP